MESLSINTRHAATRALLALLCAANWLSAEPTWVNEQGARLVIGQASFTRASPVSTRSVIGAAGGVAVGGDYLIVAEGNRIGASPINNRVLVYNNRSGFVLPPEAELPQGSQCPACVGVPDVVLGQPNFETFDPGTDAGGMRAPSGVATDGQILAVADTNNNRVLIWRSIPGANSTPPDVVVGQPDLSTSMPRTTREGMRGPQGVWIDSGRLFVADTQNSRILIWNSIPASNGQGADIVVGQPDFDTRPEPDLTQSDYSPDAQRLLDPVSVSVSNNRMFVADLGFDRVMVYLSIPTQNGFPADIVIGQPDFQTTGFIDHDDDPFTVSIKQSVFALCDQIGPFDDDGSLTPDDNIFPQPVDRCEPDETDEEDDCRNDLETPRYPRRCESTLNFPRFALSDGERLFIADSGNDRILVYNEIPQVNGAPADSVIGQPDFIALTDSTGPGNVRAPTSLAHDGENLYAADPFGRRVLVFTAGEPLITQGGVVNGASFSINATGHLEWNESTEEDQLVTVELSGRKYEFRTEAGWTGADVRDRVIELINADPFSLVSARPFNGPGTFARARIKFSGSTRAGDRLALRVGDVEYTVETPGPPEDPGAFIVVDRFVFVVGDSHPDVIIQRDPTDVDTLLITSRTAGSGANGIPVSFSIPSGSPLVAELSGDSLAGGSFPARARLTSLLGGRPGNRVTVTSTIGGAGILASASGSRLSGGSDAEQLPPGSFAAIFGEGFADQVYEAAIVSGELPRELGGVRVYCNGIQAPLYAVTPNQVNFQVPWEILADPGLRSVGLSTYVWRRMPDGSVVVSAPRSNDTQLIPQSTEPAGNFTRAAPGIFAYPGNEPRRAVALHAAGPATGQVGIGTTSSGDDEDVSAGIAVSIDINGRRYTYTTVGGDNLEKIRDGLIAAINAGDGDPNVFASPGRTGFFSARATIDFGFDVNVDPTVGATATILVGGREYSYTVREGDSVETIRNILVDSINSGLGDPLVTARPLFVVGGVQMQVVARSLGVDGNDIPFSVEVSDGAGFTMDTDIEGDTLEGGQTPPVVILTARIDGPDGNSISYEGSAEHPSDTIEVTATGRQDTLCCGNIPFSLITDDNPAVPGETIILYASGLGLTSPLPRDEGLKSGQMTPSEPLLQVPFNASDFVSSLAGGRTARLEFAGLAPGFVGLYQVNLTLNEQLPDDPETPLTVAQLFFISNTVTIPVKNLSPRDPDDL